MLFLIEKEGAAMENMDLGRLITAGLCGIGLIQLIMWVVLIIRHPGLDELRLDLVEVTPTKSSDAKVPPQT
jgi:hypothetical protein